MSKQQIRIMKFLWEFQRLYGSRLIGAGIRYKIAHIEWYLKSTQSHSLSLSLCFSEHACKQERTKFNQFSLPHSLVSLCQSHSNETTNSLKTKEHFAIVHWELSNQFMNVAASESVCETSTLCSFIVSNSMWSVHSVLCFVWFVSFFSCCETRNDSFQKSMMELKCL